MTAGRFGFERVSIPQRLPKNKSLAAVKDIEREEIVRQPRPSGPSLLKAFAQRVRAPALSLALIWGRSLKEIRYERPVHRCCLCAGAGWG